MSQEGKASLKRKSGVAGYVSNQQFPATAEILAVLERTVDLLCRKDVGNPYLRLLHTARVCRDMCRRFGPSFCVQRPEFVRPPVSGRELIDLEAKVVAAGGRGMGELLQFAPSPGRNTLLRTFLAQRDDRLGLRALLAAGADVHQTAPSTPLSPFEVLLSEFGAGTFGRRMADPFYYDVLVDMASVSPTLIPGLTEPVVAQMVRIIDDPIGRSKGADLKAPTLATDLRAILAAYEDRQSGARTTIHHYLYIGGSLKQDQPLVKLVLEYLLGLRSLVPTPTIAVAAIVLK